MPPARKFNKEDIIEAACNVVKEEGLEGLNARRIAKELESSVQPIFHNFESMEELKDAVMAKIYDTYMEYILSGINDEQAYKQTGLSYIRFAREFPEFFKILFMSSTDLKAESYITADAAGKDIIESGQKLTGFSYDDQVAFHKKVWIFTHGLATLVATDTVDFTDEEIDELLTSTVFEMLTGNSKFLAAYKEKEKDK